MPRKVSKNPFSLCVIGNSHVAAIKQAWTNRAPAVARDFSVTFFSAAVRLLEKLELEGDVLVPKNDELLEKLRYTSDGHEQIELSQYDAFVLFGMGFGLDVPKYCEGFDVITKNRRAPEGALLSRSAYSAVLEAALEDTFAVRLVDMLRSLGDKPILLCGAPFLSERVLKDELHLAAQERYRDMEFLDCTMSASKSAGARIAARHRCDLLWQPESTIGPPGFTKEEFGLNPVRFTMRGRPAPPADRRHGNEEYGFLMLNAALQRLDTMTGGRVLPAKTGADATAHS